MKKTTYLRPYEKLRERLAELRDSSGCTQEELGRRLGKPQSYVSKAKSGERRLDLVEYVYWTKALGIEPTGLVAQLAEDIGRVLPAGRRRAILKQDDTAG